MGGLHAVEDRPTPKEVYNWRLYTEALIIATGSLLQVFSLPSSAKTGVLMLSQLWI